MTIAHNLFNMPPKRLTALARTSSASLGRWQQPTLRAQSPSLRRFIAAAACCLFLLAQFASAATTAFRPPSVPLVPCDPYFCIWSPADHLADADTVHWTGKPHRLTSLARIDGKAFRLMGKEPVDLPTLEQTDLQLTPTATIYRFQGAGIRLELSFLRPALPDNLDVLSSPFIYVTWKAQSQDNATHDVQVYFDAASELAVDRPAQEVSWSTETVSAIQKKRGFRLKHSATSKQPAVDALLVERVGSDAQPVLQRKGDDLRIEWGYLYIAAPKGSGTTQVIKPGPLCRQAFVSSGALPEGNDAAKGLAAKDAPVGATVFSLGKVGSQETQPAFLILAYDDLYSIQYFKQNLRAYWRRNGWQAQDLLAAAAQGYADLNEACRNFDAELMAVLTKAGGESYAQICALAYRQCLAANKIVADAKGQPLMFPKENFSNGCIGTVDVIYPMAPQFLFLNPSLAKAMLTPILDYAASPRWRWPFAPHDLGTYPLANGQVYGGGERTEKDQMPVEETGNMLILLHAIALIDGNPSFSAKYWPILDKWADFLKAKGFDPENQLCTDDFAGHLAHNVNLSAKAICGLGAYAQLCAMRGDKAKAKEIMQLASQFAERWTKEANDGDHFRLAFDKPGTWSQKYNLVWDRILGLHLFPAEVLRKEMDFYKNHQNTYGVPLDSRKDYTKLDWTLWSATLTQDRSDFDALVTPVHRFLNESPTRVPMTDWYDTKTAKMSGFQARSVVGGVFLQMLYDQTVWKAWASRDSVRPRNWAPLPPAPAASQTVTVLPTADEKAAAWKFTTESQADGWFKPEFDAASWKEGTSGFGTRGTPGSTVRTEWSTKDIWLRREFTLPAGKWNSLQLRVHHDEDAEIYINGVPAASLSGWVSEYEVVPIQAAAKKALKPGPNLLAVHCHQTTGGQYIDVGLVNMK